MTVKKLISLLREMPQNLRVGVSMHDNYEWEISGWVQDVEMLDRSAVNTHELLREDKERFDSLPEKMVVVRC